MRSVNVNFQIIPCNGHYDRPKLITYDVVKSEYVKSSIREHSFVSECMSPTYSPTRIPYTARSDTICRLHIILTNESQL